MDCKHDWVEIRERKTVTSKKGNAYKKTVIVLFCRKCKEIKKM